MNLDEGQRKKVAAWIAEGLKLSDIQKRLSSELGISITYMDLRFLVDDLKLTPKDPERPKPVDLGASAGKNAQSGPASSPAPAPDPGKPDSLPAPAPGGPGSVSLSVDQLARQGALVSGRVTFTDGNSADWYLDQFGRLGLAPQQTGYKPSQTDLQAFQMALDGELRKMGF
jgi:hypothetical protein